MLALSRNVGEVIVITTPAGEVIEVELVAITGVSRRQARIGISAPKSVVIERKEIIGRPKSVVIGGAK